MADVGFRLEQVRALIHEEGEGWEVKVLDKVTELENELEISKVQATVYKQDFERERSDREEAHGRHQTDVNHLSQQLDQFMLDATTGNQCVQCNQQLAEWKKLEAVKNEEIYQLRVELRALSQSKQNADRELTKLREAIARMKQIQAHSSQRKHQSVGYHHPDSRQSSYYDQNPSAASNSDYPPQQDGRNWTPPIVRANYVRQFPSPAAYTTPQAGQQAQLRQVESGDYSSNPRNISTHNQMRDPQQIFDGDLRNVQPLLNQQVSDTTVSPRYGFSAARCSSHSSPPHQGALEHHPTFQVHNDYSRQFEGRDTTASNVQAPARSVQQQQRVSPPPCSVVLLCHSSPTLVTEASHQLHQSPRAAGSCQLQEDAPHPVHTELYQNIPGEPTHAHLPE